MFDAIYQEVEFLLCVKGGSNIKDIIKAINKLRGIEREKAEEMKIDTDCVVCVCVFVNEKTIKLILQQQQLRKEGRQ